MIQPDFSQRKHFPGTSGNRFDVILHSAAGLERIPAFLFAILLFFIAALAARFHWDWCGVVWGFFLVDWALVAGLPIAGKSYGPPKPTLLVLAIMRSLFALLPVYFALPLEAIGTLLVVYAFWVEPQRISLTSQTLITKNLSPGSAIKILHLGDLHVERITTREKQLAGLITSTQPDVILFSGDILNLSYLKDTRAQQDARSIMGQWTAPYGVFVVNGSPAVDLMEDFPGLIAGLPLHWLRDERLTLNIRGQPIDLVGVTNTHKPFIDGPKLIELTKTPSDHFTVLLYHTPDLAPVSAQQGIDLQLSGHTHGGQVRLPFIGALFTGSLYGKRFEAGRVQVGGMTLYITRGIGLEGAAAPRVRFLCPPEVILWTIIGHAG